ncbi:MAG TPA: GNAT family N-acetyltransferase [Sedimentisphaerales bacterium]|nr:GNAT family N-acetyltransferase [Sedimentisphaerales bacterium]
MMGSQSVKENELTHVNSPVGRAPGRDIGVQVFNNFEQLAAMQQEWDDFVESVEGEIFLTYDWCRIWWKYYGTNRDLKVFVFRSGDEVVGILPLFFERLWLGPVYVRAAKLVGSDFTICQFSVPVKPEYMEAVVQKFVGAICEYKWDIMHIGPIAGLYKDFGHLKGAFEEFLGSSYFVQDRQKDVQTYFQLVGNWEDQLSTIGRNERGNVRRNYNAIRKLSSNASSPLDSFFATKDNLAALFQDFIAMHQSRWNTVGKAGHFKDWPSAEEFHRDLAETQLARDRLRLLRVEFDNQCLGYQYGYKFGAQFTHFLSARSDPSLLEGITLGRITFCELVKKALEEKMMWIDSLRSRYEYKMRLGAKLFPIRNIYVFPQRLTMLVRIRLFEALAWLLNMSYYKIWFCRIAPKLPFKRRSLWNIWIRTCVLAR